MYKFGIIYDIKETSLSCLHPKNLNSTFKRPQNVLILKPENLNHKIYFTISDLQEITTILAQIENALLGIVYATSTFHNFVPSSQCPSFKHQRLKITLLKYQIVVKFTPDKYIYRQMYLRFVICGQDLFAPKEKLMMSG